MLKLNKKENPKNKYQAKTVRKRFSVDKLMKFNEFNIDLVKIGFGFISNWLLN